MLDLTPIREASERIDRLNTESEFRAIKEHRTIGAELVNLLAQLQHFEALVGRLNDVPRRGEERFPTTYA